ncbi:MAG: YggS family pyridoxal phosphate-dependent enzyme [Clostridia bacterium]
MQMNNIPEKIEMVRDQIAEAADKSGRKLSDIHLIAVTKSVAANDMNLAIENGIQDIGENRVQELLMKYNKISGKVTWHFIGQLQTNKVKYIIDKVSLIHSLDRISLAKEIHKRCQKTGRRMPVLVQVNIAREASKAGVYQENLLDFLQELSKMPSLAVQGLMMIAPFSENPEELRPYFRRMKDWFDRLKDMDIPGVDMRYLSMGMSNDFRIAIEEGSNMVRLGSVIFGKRNNQ